MDEKPEKLAWWVTPLGIAFFILVLPAIWPLLAGALISDKIRDRWPDSERAREWAYFLRLLVPIGIILAEMGCLLVFFRWVSAKISDLDTASFPADLLAKSLLG